MKLQRFEVSETPHLTIECHGDLDINGGREGEVAVKAYGREDELEVTVEDERFTITAQARCKVGCPRGTVLSLQTVYGDLRVRGVDGPITVERVHGDALLKGSGPTNAVNVGGDVRARAVNGDLHLDHVGGDLSVRGVEGALTCDRVGGDLSAVYIEGGLEATVGGDSSLKTDFTPGCEYRLTTGGDASVNFPTNANARIETKAGGGIDHRVDWAEVEEGAHILKGRVGEGDATVTINAGGDVSLKSRSDSGAFVFSFALPDEGLEFELESMAEAIERNIEAHMARLNAELEAKLSHVDHEAIRRKAERTAAKVRRKAERAAERARIKAERAQRRWERMGAPQPTRPMRGGPAPQPPSDPITDEERRMVLKMVQEGKITTDEAAKLLEALEG